MKASGKQHPLARLPLPAPSRWERIVSRVAPGYAGRLYRSRCAMAMAASYTGASKTRRSMVNWSVSAGDADTDILPDLPALRERSRDLARNNSLAGAALCTKVESVVGSGLKLQARPDRDRLGLTDEQADAWEDLVEAEFRLWAAHCDHERILTFAGLQELAFRSVFENGDVLVNTPARADRATPYTTRVQLIEADRVCNADSAEDTESLSGGVERRDGVPYRYHVLDQHPGSLLFGRTLSWTRLPAFGARTGRRSAWLLYHKTRIGQYRGVPDLAPVIEDLKTLGDYKDAELQASLIASFFTVFITSPDGLGVDTADTGATTRQKVSDPNLKLGSGVVVDLAPGEAISTANPGRPNQAFEGFLNAITGEIGARLGLPLDVLSKRFHASYSAARAALLEAWRYFQGRRRWLAVNFCGPLYELFLTEAVAIGRVEAPGFLSGDPLIRQAWLGAEWIGDAPGHIDEGRAVTAAKARIDAGLSNEAIETTALTGYDRDMVYRGRRKEIQQRQADGMMPFELQLTPNSGKAEKTTEASNAPD